MIAFKGFTKELTARLGNGIYQFEPGRTYVEESSKTVRSGFHCCENPFECLTYYSLNGENRFFMVEAAGSIDEDGQERIACTELTLIKELSVLEFALEGMKYIIKHPNREKWQVDYETVKVLQDMAEAGDINQIAIARGENPCVKGVIGSILGIIRETPREGVRDAKIFVVNATQTGKWLTLDADRKIKEVQHEETAGGNHTTT